MNKILDRPCKKCWKLNRWHEIFISNIEKNCIFYEVQYRPDLAPCFISQHDHYYEFPTNLELLEHKYEQ
jgi:hypothetical protein